MPVTKNTPKWSWGAMLLPSHKFLLYERIGRSIFPIGTICRRCKERKAPRQTWMLSSTWLSSQESSWSVSITLFQYFSNSWFSFFPKVTETPSRQWEEARLSWSLLPTTAQPSEEQSWSTTPLFAVLPSTTSKATTSSSVLHAVSSSPCRPSSSAIQETQTSSRPCEHDRKPFLIRWPLRSELFGTSASFSEHWSARCRAIVTQWDKSILNTISICT